jgi:prepilin-type N-terminal cleavage/methylation domain-containing protein
MRPHRTFGFTLVEVLVALVILAAAAAMAGLFASTSMGRGAAETLSFNDELACATPWRTSPSTTRPRSPRRP